MQACTRPTIYEQKTIKPTEGRLHYTEANIYLGASLNICNTGSTPLSVKEYYVIHKHNCMLVEISQVQQEENICTYVLLIPTQAKMYALSSQQFPVEN